MERLNKRSAEQLFRSTWGRATGSLACMKWGMIGMGAVLALGVSAFAFSLAGRDGGSGTSTIVTTITPAAVNGGVAGHGRRDVARCSEARPGGEEAGSERHQALVSERR
jgi:hypothetical protein